MKTKKNNSYDGIIGLALADSMGVPVEFSSRASLDENPVLGVEGYGMYAMPPGAWSDDTSLTLATIDAILKNKGVINDRTYEFIGENFLKYCKEGKFTPTGRMFDIGNTTRCAISLYANSTLPATQCGGKSENNKGNGALMRILPIAYYAYCNNLDSIETYEIVKNVASITHALEICVLGSYIYVQFARQLLEGHSKTEAYQLMQQSDYSMFSQQTLNEYSRVLKGNIADYSRDEIKSVGKTLETLEAALWSFLNNENYDSTVLTAINLGNDTDTVAACAGGLAGIYYGSDSINKDWLSQLIKLDYIRKLCNAFDLSLKKQE